MPPAAPAKRDLPPACAAQLSAALDALRRYSNRPDRSWRRTGPRSSEVADLSLANWADDTVIHLALFVRELGRADPAEQLLDYLDALAEAVAVVAALYRARVERARAAAQPPLLPAPEPARQEPLL